MRSTELAAERESSVAVAQFILRLMDHGDEADALVMHDGLFSRSESTNTERA